MGKTKNNNTKKEKNFIEMDGDIIECLPSTHFNVELDNGMIINCVLSGKLRMNYIKLITGDRVKLELSPYDLTKGRIVYRYI